jgi:hypothetical protein
MSKFSYLSPRHESLRMPDADKTPQPMRHQMARAGVIRKTSRADPLGPRGSHWTRSFAARRPLHRVHNRKPALRTHTP